MANWPVVAEATERAGLCLTFRLVRVELQEMIPFNLSPFGTLDADGENSRGKLQNVVAVGSDKR